MDTFITLTSIAAPLPEANVDTDIIFPARFLLVTDKKGLGQYAFYEKRYAAPGVEKPDFVLNQAPYRAAQILIAGDNFGCGSSREQAPWALQDLGIRCVISTSFGEIFYSNCFKNSMLPITVTAAELALLHAEAVAARPLTVDLIGCRILLEGGTRIDFNVADWRRDALLNGWDEIDLIIKQNGAHIAAFETRQKIRMPWLYA
jgi:3-isopropylmalate dehydratase small subunit